MKVNYFWSLEFRKLLDSENKRVGYEWLNIKDLTDDELIDKQIARWLKVSEKHKVKHAI